MGVLVPIPGLSPELVAGLPIALFMLIVAIGQPYIGAYTERVGHRKVMTQGAVVGRGGLPGHRHGAQPAGPVALALTKARQTPSLTLVKANTRHRRTLRRAGPVCPVSTEQEPTMYQRILVPTDGSEITAKAVAAAVSLAKLSGASLVTLCVKEPFPYSAISEMQPVPPQEFYDAQERIAAGRVKAVLDAAAAAGVACEGASVEALHPWEAILDTARQKGCDLVVMASHGRRGMAALLIGSETSRVLTHSTLPVLVVK